MRSIVMPVHARLFTAVLHVNATIHFLYCYSDLQQVALLACYVGTRLL